MHLSSSAYLLTGGGDAALAVEAGHVVKRAGEAPEGGNTQRTEHDQGLGGEPQLAKRHGSFG